MLPALTVADTGAWNISGGRYIGAPGVGQPIALASGALDVGSSYVLQLEARLLASATGGVVFDYYDADDFKWAAVDKASGKVLLGHYTERAGWVVDASVAKTLGTKDVTLAVTLKGSTVSVLLNGSAALSNVYNALVTDGGYGLVAKGGQASFDSFTVRTDDPDFAGEPGGVLTLETATPADGADGAAPLALADAERLAREAIRRWSLAADPALVAAMQAADIGIADLPGQTLGEYRDGTIFVDVDAAGHGWFVDQTAWEDREFGADGVAAHGPAAGRIDLLSALAHELGHAAGYGHSDAGVMADRLATGTRVQPAPNNAAPPPFAGIPGFAMSFEAPRGEPAGDAGEDDVPVIAWNVSPPLSVGRANQAAWAHDFANHLGKNEAERNPNASLRLHLDTVNDTTPEVAML